MNDKSVQKEIDTFMEGLIKRNAGQPEFHQAVQEATESIMPFMLDNPKYRKAQILERLTEPDRIIIFRVSWMDDEGNYRVNRGYRVQCNNAIGPYKGGLRFHPSVNESILKFLAFEQTLKNSLTTLPMGGAKGGANFNPKGKSDNEVMRFCQSFMTELTKHIGKDTDVPAGDIGVGAREIGFLFGQYMRMINEFTGALTGKGLEFGGSKIRKEATGFGCVYLVEQMLERNGDSVEGKTCAVSGSGNVAQHTIEKLLHLGAKPVTASDSGGTIYDPDGIDMDKLNYIMDLKNVRRGRISEYAEKFGCEYLEGKRPWGIPCDIAFPSATQNEISAEDAQTLVDNGIKVVGEGANMPTVIEGINIFQDAKVLFAPSKAANAGGVTVSGLEQSQNAQRMSWTAVEVDEKLKSIMKEIHIQCVKYGDTDSEHIDYVKGANLAGFVRVADAMLAYGVV
ncbi:MAG TPA: NADP-specific glutamate dehydrogenase [Candidatus Hydrogenedentes bacterium]|jgi:glutamate dehydrogenase (NADP+)|nr:NADP-specific glutamate dehydrogenase [Candidatus Hydrogenedentota bacterium]